MKETKSTENTENRTDQELFESKVFDFLSKKYDLSKDEIKSRLEAKPEDMLENSFPLLILRTENLSSLESLVKYLREKKRLSYDEIGKLLRRNKQSLASTYSVAFRKNSAPFDSDIEQDSDMIPFSVFDGGLSVLESIVYHLKSKNYSYSKIARLLGKDPRTVWTVCKRADNKIKSKDARH